MKTKQELEQEYQELLIEYNECIRVITLTENAKWKFIFKMKKNRQELEDRK